MPKKRTGAKAGDPEARRPFVQIFHDQMNSMAGKTLSFAAFWLFGQIKKAWAGSDHEIKLSFAAVSWKMAFTAFNKARHELELAGFIDIINSGGLSEGGKKNPGIYSLSERWRLEVSKRLADDPQAGVIRQEWQKSLETGKLCLVPVWYPTKKRRTSAENWKKAAAALARKRAAAGLQKKAKIIPKIKPKRIPKSPDQEITAARESFKRRLRNGIAFTERPGHG